MKTKKKIIIPLFLAIACLIAGIAGGIFISLKQNAGQNTSPEHYFSKSEQVSSITGIVGERSTAEALEEPPLEKASESSTIVYNYSSDTVQQDVEDYVTYLKSEKDFIEITGAHTDAGNEPFTTRYLAGASQDEDSYLSLIIKESTDSYSISAVKETQPWTSFLTELWNTSYQQIAPVEASPTIVSAEEQVRSASQQFLKLPNPTDSYRFISKRGLIRLYSNDYYCVSAYLPNEIGTFDYECAFLVDAASGAVKYQYDEGTGDVFPLQ